MSGPGGDQNDSVTTNNDDNVVELALSPAVPPAVSRSTTMTTVSQAPLLQSLGSIPPEHLNALVALLGSGVPVSNFVPVMTPAGGSSSGMISRTPPVTEQHSAERRDTERQKENAVSPTARRRQEPHVFPETDIDESELSDIPAPTKNEHNWVLIRSGQVLPDMPYTGKAPDPRNSLAYTAWTLNNMVHSFDNEGLLWTILRSGGEVRKLERLLKVKMRTTGATSTVYSELKLGRPQSRTAIAAHAKLVATNTSAQVCTACQHQSSTGPFRTCITTAEFGGSCTNCQYHSKASVCSLRNAPAATTVSAPAATSAKTRGTKRPRTTTSSDNERFQPAAVAPKVKSRTYVLDILPQLLRRVTDDELVEIREQVNRENDCRS